MILHDVVQGDAEWLYLRAGIPTASEFDRIVTPGGKLCKAEKTENFMYRLLAEWWLGRPIITASTAYMDRGAELEGQAVKAYELMTGEKTNKIGIITTDDKLIGASPDRLVGSKKVAEIKCPLEIGHLSYLITGSIEDEYKVQIQGQLWVCERDEADAVSFHPEFPLAVIRVGRDEPYIKLLSSAVTAFRDQMLEAREMIQKVYGPLKRDKQPDDMDGLGLTQEEVDAALASILS